MTLDVALHAPMCVRVTSNPAGVFWLRTHKDVVLPKCQEKRGWLKNKRSSALLANNATTA